MSTKKDLLGIRLIDFADWNQFNKILKEKYNILQIVDDPFEDVVRIYFNKGDHVTINSGQWRLKGATSIQSFIEEFGPLLDLHYAYSRGDK